MRRFIVIAVSSALAGATLSGCTTSGGSSDDRVGRLLVAPGKFVLYNCGQLAQADIDKAERERELEVLMAKAGTSADGRLVSSMAYRPEYLTVRAERAEIRKTAREKNCPAPGPSRVR